jgi:voltage-gated potassium channel
MSKQRAMIFHKIGLSGVAHDENPLAVKFSSIFNSVVAAFILLVPIMWLVDQLPEFKIVDDWLLVASWLIWGILITEMAIMLVIVHNPWHYLKTNWLNIPIVILTFPLILSSIPYAILLRVVQFMVFARYLTEMHRGLQRLFQVSQLGAIVLAFIVIVILSGIVIHSIDPSINNLEEGLWYSLATMATVGYGDIVPSSTEGRIFGAVIIVMGTVFFSLLTAQLAAYMVGEDELERDKELLNTLKENQKALTALQIQNEKRDNEQLEMLILQLSQRLDRIEQRLAQSTPHNQSNQHNSGAAP